MITRMKRKSKQPFHTSTDEQPTHQFRACRSSYVVLCSIFAFPLLMSLMSLLDGSGDSSWWIAVGICVSVIGFTILWLSHMQITLTNKSIRYKTLFHRPTSLPFEEIESAETQIGHLKRSDRFKPYVRLVIMPYNSSELRPLIINIKPFDAKDLEYIFEAIESNLNENQ